MIGYHFYRFYSSTFLPHWWTSHLDWEAVQWKEKWSRYALTCLLEHLTHFSHLIHSGLDDLWPRVLTFDSQHLHRTRRLIWWGFLVVFGTSCTPTLPATQKYDGIIDGIISLYISMLSMCNIMIYYRSSASTFNYTSFELQARETSSYIPESWRTWHLYYNTTINYIMVQLWCDISGCGLNLFFFGF